MLIRPLIDSDRVEARIDEIAMDLYRDYADSPFSLLCVGDGARRFVEALTDRLRQRSVGFDVLWVRASRETGSSHSPVQVDGFDASALEGRDVLVVDAVADEGVTLRAVLELVEFAEARTVRTAVLVDKRARRRESVRLDYVGFTVERGWVVGYGMDVDGEFADLDELGIVGEVEFPAGEDEQ